MQAEEESVRYIESEVYEWEGSYYAHSGSNDYSRDVTDVFQIVDSSGVAHGASGGSSWNEVCQGVEMRSEGLQVFMRITRSACPVRVRFRHWTEYASYDGRGHSEQSTRFYWVRYERRG